MNKKMFIEVKGSLIDVESIICVHKNDESLLYYIVFCLKDGFQHTISFSAKEERDKAYENICDIFLGRKKEESEYISALKINKKIEELKSAQESTNKSDWKWIYQCQIDILEELLEELLKGGTENESRK